MTIETVLKGVEALEKKLTDMAAKADGEMKTIGDASKDTKTALENLGKEQLAIAQRLMDLEQKGALTGREGDEGAKGAESVGQMFTKGEQYANFVKSGMQRGGVSEEIALKNTVTSANALLPPMQAGFLPGAFRSLTIESLLNAIPTSDTAIRYVKENVFTNSAAEVAEGAQKPESSITFTEQTTPVQTIAHWIKITEQLAADAPALAAYINTRMVYGVNLRVENQLVAGNGVSPNLDGLTKAGNFTAHGYTAANLTSAGLTNNRFDLIGMMIGDSEASDWPATAIICNPADWWKMRLAKETSGQYLIAGVGLSGSRQLFDLPVATSNAMPAGKVMVANLALAASFYTRQAMTVEMSKHDTDNFQKNLITIRAERRCALAIERPAAIRYGDLVPA